MNFFLDSANINEIKELTNLRVIDGVTTNPSLIAKENKDFISIVTDICSITQGDVSIEVTTNDCDSMIMQGTKIASISPNIVIKLPITWDGIKACKYFASNGVKVNMTLCFSVFQALLAAKAGATYVSPFIGRLEDIGQDGLGLVKDIKQIYNNYNFQTKILVASVRSLDHIYYSALYGAELFTASSKIIKQLVDHPLTTQGLKIFEQDWLNSKLSI